MVGQSTRPLPDNYPSLTTSLHRFCFGRFSNNTSMCLTTSLPTGLNLTRPPTRHYPRMEDSTSPDMSQIEGDQRREQVARTKKQWIATYFSDYWYVAKRLYWLSAACCIFFPLSIYSTIFQLIITELKMAGDVCLPKYIFWATFENFTVVSGGPRWGLGHCSSRVLLSKLNWELTSWPVNWSQTLQSDGCIGQTLLVNWSPNNLNPQKEDLTNDLRAPQ